LGLAEHVDFEALAACIDTAAPRPSRVKGGRSPYSTVLMINILVLQQLYNQADDALEYQLLDRRSFLRFLDLTESSSISDAKAIWLFRDRPREVSVTRYSSKSSNNYCRKAIWRVTARSSMPPWSWYQLSATSARKPKR
jgi:hypothetical protein